MRANESALLVVDDEEEIRVLMARILRGAGYESVLLAASSEEARSLLATKDVTLMLTDMQMAGGSGLELLEHVHANMHAVATLMVTATDDADLADKALAVGAYGYIIKPFRKSEILIQVNNALRRRGLELDNQEHRDRLEEKVKLRTSDLWATIVKLEHSERDVRASRAETLERLSIAGDFHDVETGFHVARMSRFCELLAARCGDEELCSDIREASSLHDLGKIGIPDRILLKPGPLLPDERLVMEQHTNIGHSMLSNSASPLLQLAAEVALTHHEKVDGSGYPNRLKGDAIPLSGRIAAIADVFDALTSNRVYRRAYPLVEAVTMMKEQAGTHFDSDLLSVFWDVLPEVLSIEHEYRPQKTAAEHADALAPVETVTGAG